MSDSLKRTGDEVLARLRSLYGQSGYSHYKMNKFEEYDLYANNKDFLISDSVITFTDGNGKLLALKPDVTLSIVKNSRDGEDGTEKLYYTENVYRVTKGSRNYKEIMQVGLECLGNVDDYCIYEVLKLALASLSEISPSNVLSVSHLGLLSEVIDAAGIPAEQKTDVLRCIGDKNLHELTAIMESSGVTEDKANIIGELVRLNGECGECLDKIRRLLAGVVKEETLAEFSGVLESLTDEPSLRIDFSVVGDIRYYNGFVFKGYVREIPTGVLSGGQYDMLMRKMGRSARAIGFAVYLDLIERYSDGGGQFDVDTVVIYDGASTPREIGEITDEIKKNGKSVLACTSLPGKIRYKEIIRVKHGRAE